MREKTDRCISGYKLVQGKSLTASVAAEKKPKYCSITVRADLNWGDYQRPTGAEAVHIGGYQRQLPEDDYCTDNFSKRLTA
ncbi:hypothetical protein [Izhakiella capsodis]|uniref:hypothetical protein n=1 Tax=Izhakiella capsodis TaxID=1367852 RepID=UPI001160902E|nr:hypothetical protein [Izhakiella capsodis]